MIRMTIAATFAIAVSLAAPVSATAQTSAVPGGGERSPTRPSVSGLPGAGATGNASARAMRSTRQPPRGRRYRQLRVDPSRAPPVRRPAPQKSVPGTAAPAGAGKAPPPM